MEKKFFTTKQFHLWPFYNGFTWRGFLPTYSVTVDNEGISFTINNNLIEKYTAEEVEASLFNSTWFGLGKTKIVFSKKFNCDKEKRGDHWYFFHNVCCYLDPMQVSEAINAFKEIDTESIYFEMSTGMSLRLFQSPPSPFVLSLVLSPSRLTYGAT